MNSSNQKLKQHPKTEVLLLPRGYLSWSALNLFDQSEQRYIEKYFYGQDEDRSNDFMSFGKKFSLAKETGDFHGDPMLEFAINAVPSYKNAEFKIESNLITTYGIIKLLAVPDSFDDELFRVLEYKTGKIPWTQAKVQKHGQLHFYAVSTVAKYEVNPEQELWWIETLQTNSGVRPTGNVESFSFKASGEQLKEMRDRIIQACLRIDKLYRQHLTLKNV